jgi:hypothetical protein
MHRRHQPTAITSPPRLGRIDFHNSTSKWAIAIVNVSASGTSRSTGHADKSINSALEDYERPSSTFVK